MLLTTTVTEGYPFLVSAITTLILLSFSYSLAKVIYRLFFHPLSNFPGPKLAAATFWYEAYFDVLKSPGGQFTYELDRLHATYGPVIRSNPEQIHINNPEWFDVLYAGPGHVRNKWERSNRANGSPGSIASTVQHDLHRIRRGALNPFFSKKAVTALEKITGDKVQQMCMRLEDYSGNDEILDLGTAFTAVTLDVITEYCYDSCLNCVSQPGFAPQWKKLMSGLFEPVPVTKHFPWVLQVLQSLPRSWNPDFEPFLECRDTITKQARAVWKPEQRTSNLSKEFVDEKPKTIFHGIMGSNIPDSEKTIERLSDEAFVLIVAGGETTARVLTVIMTHLLQNRPLLMRLRKALDDAMGENDLFSTRTLESIPLMKAVIQEGVRIAAPVTNGAILIAPNEDLKCGEWLIPRGTPISMTLRTILFDPGIFPSPYTFDPDRWLQAEKQGTRLDRYLVTFSKGSRACLGINVAYSEMYLGIAALVSKFDMELYEFDQQRDLDIVRDCFVGLPSKRSKGVRVKVRPRE